MIGFGDGGCRIKKGGERETTEDGFGDCCYKPSKLMKLNNIEISDIKIF